MSPGLVLLTLRVIMGVVLIGFLVFVLIMLRRDLRQSPRVSTTIPEAKLLVEAESSQARSFDLEDINLIGRAADNTIVLETEVVSAHHARLTYLSGKQWWLEDLGSRNGTLVNGVPVEQPLAVRDGDQITFGTVSCQLISDGKSAEDPS